MNNDKIIHSMTKFEFMDFVRNEVYMFSDYDDVTRKGLFQKFSWFVRGVQIGKGWVFYPEDWEKMGLPVF